MNTGFENLNQAFISAFKNYVRRTAYKVGRDGHHTDIRYEDLEKLTLRFVSYLRSAGLAPGDRVLIAAKNSPEWMAACIASFLSGAIVVPASTSARPDILAFISKDSSASMVFAEDAAIAKSISEACNVQPRVVVMSGGGGGGKNDSLQEILKSHDPHGDPRSLYGKAGELTPEKRAVIFYTALDSGRPRGAVFSHGGLITTLLHVSEWFTLDEYDLGFTTLSWSYFPSFITGLHYVLSGVGNALSGGFASVFDDLQQTSPTVTVTSPFAIENIYTKIMSELNDMPESRRKAFEWALALGRRYHASESTASKELRERYTRADMTFFGRMRAMLGGRLSRIYSAGAPLSNELVGYVEAIGLMPLNIYAGAESGGFPAVSSPFARRPGSCGQVAPGFQIRISDEGEVLVRGKTVVRDYWNNPPESERVTDADGWLHTGDIGRFDPDGYLMLTGHKQSVFMLSYGRKISPSKIEGYLAESPYISRAVVLGEGKAYVSALIVPDLGAIAAHHAENGGGGAPAPMDILSPEVKNLVDETVSEVNSRLNLWERIEAYTLIESAGEAAQGQAGNGAPGRRAATAEKFGAYVAAMYPDTVNIGKTDITQVQIEPDQLRDLLEKQDILQAWMEDAGIGFLLDLARTKSIDALAMINICETAASVAQIQSEEKPVSTALIVGDSTYISRILPDSEIQFQRYDHIRRMQQVVITLAKIVDGVVLGYGIDRHGFLRKVHKLEISVEESSNFLLGPQFRRHAAISRECDAIVFYVPTGGKQVRVFSEGQMVARYANGNWKAENLPRIDLTVDRIAVARGYDVDLLRRIFKCAFLMSERNLGAIFIIGDAAKILKKSDPPEISPFATIADSQISRLSDGEIINFAKQDGATIIDSVEGKLRGCMVLLRPSAETRSEIGIGKGARHSSASKMSAEADCLAIAVSQDGPITIYDRGERVLSI